MSDAVHDPADETTVMTQTSPQIVDRLYYAWPAFSLLCGLAIIVGSFGPWYFIATEAAFGGEELTLAGPEMDGLHLMLVLVGVVIVVLSALSLAPRFATWLWIPLGNVVMGVAAVTFMIFLQDDVSEIRDIVAGHATIDTQWGAITIMLAGALVIGMSLFHTIHSMTISRLARQAVLADMGSGPSQTTVEDHGLDMLIDDAEDRDSKA